MTDNKWLITNYTPETTMLSSIVLTYTQVLDLSTSVNNLTLESVLFGDYSKWCSSLMYYPIKINDDTSKQNKFSAGGVTYDVENFGAIGVNKNAFGYTMGEVLYPTSTSFLDYEPYVKLEVYLPYYGFTQLKVADVVGKYIQFRLYVDWNTGMAQYVIGVNANSVAIPNAPSLIGVDDTDTRIIGTYNFQLGASIPVGSTNFNETVRNTILGVGKGIAMIGGSFASDLFPSSRSVSTSKTVNTSRNKATGRQIRKSTSTTEKERKTYSYSTNERLNTAINTSNSVLGNLSVSPSGITSNNPNINRGMCQSIVLVKHKSKPTVDIQSNEMFKHLLGLPNGTCDTLSNFTGFTTISDIHLEGEGFAQATLSEMEELKQTVKQGIIL